MFQYWLESDNNGSWCEELHYVEVAEWVISAPGILDKETRSYTGNPALQKSTQEFILWTSVPFFSTKFSESLSFNIQKLLILSTEFLCGVRMILWITAIT